MGHAGASGQPQDIAELVTVSSGAFKVVALTKEQLRAVTLKKQSKVDPIVLQPKDIEFALSKSPAVNSASQKMMGSPIAGYGFDSVALNAKVRRLPDGLGTGSSNQRKTLCSPDKRTYLSTILVSKFLPSEADCV